MSLPTTTRINIAHRARQAAAEYAEGDALLVMDNDRVAGICEMRSPLQRDGRGPAWEKGSKECEAFTVAFWRHYHTCLVG